MKTAVNVDRNALLKAIANVESVGPLANRSVLYDAVHATYQLLAPNPKVTVSVIMLRITKENIPVLTPVGKRGRQKGQKIGHVNRTKRADKMNVKALQVLRNETPTNYHNLVDKVASGSVKAMCKLMCLQCVGFERMVKEDDKPSSRAIDQIGDCRIMGCALWQIRPFQKG